MKKNLTMKGFVIREIITKFLQQVILICCMVSFGMLQNANSQGLQLSPDPVDKYTYDLLGLSSPCIPVSVTTSDAATCLGNPASIGLSIGGAYSALTYQWQIFPCIDLIDGTNYTNTNGRNLNIAQVEGLDGEHYRVIAGFDPTVYCSTSVTSNFMTLNVFQAPVVTVVPSDPVCQGQQGTLTGIVTNEGTGPGQSPGPFTYTWYDFSGSPTEQTLPVSVSTTYHVMAVSFLNCFSIAGGNITVNSLPVIFNVTGGGPYCAGGDGSPVWLDGSEVGVNYQLVLNSTTNVGSPVPGTGSSISFGNQTDVGTYTVSATNTSTFCESLMNGSAVISINDYPLITSFNVPQGCIPSQNLPPKIFTFSVTATGTEPLSFQWYKGGVLLSGETNTSFTISTNDAGDAAEYKVVVSNVCGNTSAAFTLVSCPCNLPQLFISPDVTVCDGLTGTFVVFANGGTPPLQYQWYMLDGTLIPGETTNTYTTGTEGSYYVVVSNDPTNCNESIASDPVSLILNIKPSISCDINPESGIVCEGEEVIFTAIVITGTDNGNCPMSFMWQDPSGAIVSTTLVLDMTNVTAAASGTYTFTAANCCGEATCTKDLLVNQKPTVSCAIDPENGIVCAGADVSFTGTVLTSSDTQACPVTVSWTDPKGNVLSNSLTLELTNVTIAANGTYTFTATNCCGSASCTKDLIVYQNLSLNCMESMTKANPGDIKVFSVKVTAGVNVTYQWKFDGVAIAGETNSRYTRTLQSSDNNKQVCVDITSTCGSKTCFTILSLMTCQGFATFTKGGWHATCHGGNPGCLRDRYFNRIFPYVSDDPTKPGLVVGIVSSGNYLQLTNSYAATQYLPYGGPSTQLTQAYINPASKVLKNDAVSQLVGLKFNVYYGAAGLMGTNPNLGNLCFINGILAGQSIYQFLAYADDAISGVDMHGLTIGQINSIAGSINEGFETGTLVGTMLDCVCQPIGKSSKPINTALNEIKVYPNPTSGMLNVSLPKAFPESELSIFNISGQLVYNERILDNNDLRQINMTAYLPGIYFIRLTNSEYIKTIKFIVQ